MKRYFQPYCLLLYLLSFVFFTGIGTAVAGWSGAADNQGLAGGAIVLFYGLITGLAAFAISIFLVRLAPRRTIIYTNAILATGILVSYVILRVRYDAKEKKKEYEEQQFPTEPSSPTVPANYSMVSDNDNMGIGFFIPDLYRATPLYFYGQPNFEKGVIEHVPYDSLVFRRTETGLESVYGPPWLFPEFSKLDYGIFYFKVSAIGHEMLEVIGNKRSGQVTYVDRAAGELLSWPEFLLSVNSVEFPQDRAGTVYQRPVSGADQVLIAFRFMRPIRIRRDWMEVALCNDDHQTLSTGWIQWKDKGNLLIDYSLLS